MNKCPHCGAVLKTLTRICEACGSEIKPEASASSESSTAKFAGQSAAELSTLINESLSSLKSQPPTSKLKAFVIGLFAVPTIGLSYLIVKVLNVFGRIGQSPERVKLVLDQILRAAETSFKSDPEMKALIEKGRSESKAYLQSQHESRKSLFFGLVASIILSAAIFFILQHQAKVKMQNAVAQTQLQIQRASGLLAQASATNSNSQSPAQPNALVVTFTHEPKVGIQQTKILEDLVSARIAKLGFTTLTPDLAANSISKALNQPEAGVTQENKTMLEQFADALQKPDNADKVEKSLDDQSSVIRLAQIVNADLIIIVTIDSFDTETRIFKGNELSPVATTNIFDNLLVSYRLAFAATGAAAAGDSVKITRAARDSESITHETDSLPNDMLNEAATEIATKIIKNIREGSATASSVGQNNSAPEMEIKRLCIGPIIAIESAAQKASKAGHADALQQTLETLDTTLADQANGSGKFEVVARKDALKSVLNEQDFGASGNIDPATAAQIFKLAGAQYLVLTTVTDFVMGNEDIKFEGIGVDANREAVRISCSIQIYDTTTGKLIESARFRGQDANVSREGSATADGATLTKITDRLAADILNRIVDVIYPAKVVAKLGTQITINRGEGAGTAVGQTWTVYALGEEITDPDTGEKLGRNEAAIGKIKITSVTPKLSYGETVEDTGIAVGNIVRPQQASEQPETPSPTISPATEQKPKDITDKVKGDL